jgi:hypothetical protein
MGVTAGEVDAGGGGAVCNVRELTLTIARQERNTRKRYLRSVNIVLCRNGRHCISHGERRVRGAQSEGVFWRERRGKVVWSA